MISWASPSIGDAEHNAAIKTIKSNWMTQGRVTELLENKISNYLGIKHTVVVNNGTSALICALLANGIKPGDEVIVPTFTFVATVNAILSIGARPILVDSDPKTFNTTTDLVKCHITKKTKAIIPVDVCGMPVDIKAFQELSAKNDIVLIEDAAEGLGAEYEQKKIGSFSHTAIFSFHMAKIITAVEGGCIVTNDDVVAQKAKLIRSHGSAKPYDSVMFGLNLRISDIHASIAFVQMKKINKFIKHRQTIASIYRESLRNCEFQTIPDYVSLHPYMLFAILTQKKKRDYLNNYLNKNLIETRVCWPPVHKQKFHSNLFKNAKFNGAEEIFSRIINLPMGNGLTEQDASRVVDAVNRALKN